MARPLRIEFDGAWYHVMNRGAGRRTLFHTDGHRKVFLDLLGDIQERYAVETHSYCLMGNHFHLLLRTPQANLSRAMRHLAGVYTQRFNRSTGTDGPLFRGRFRAILVDADRYLLQVSRYIHLNPVQARIVQRPEDYPWSSYAAYAGLRSPEPWLVRNLVYGMLGGRATACRRFVEAGNDSETLDFYERSRLAPVMGDRAFREGTQRDYAGDPVEIADLRRPADPPDPERIIDVVAAAAGKDRTELMRTRRGQLNRDRLLAMYACQQFGRQTLNGIRDMFGLAHYGSVNSSLNRYRRLRARDPALIDLERDIAAKLHQEQT